MGHQPPRDLLAQEGVLDGLLPALLPGGQKGAAPLVGQEDGAALLALAVFGGQLLLVDAAQYKAVGADRAQLFHQVEGQAGPPGARPVQKADIRVEAHPFQRRGALAGQQGIGKGEQRVDRVEGRPAAAPRKGEGLPLLQNEAVEAVEVALCRLALDAAQLLGGHGVLDAGQGGGQLAGEGLEPVDRHPLRVVAGGALQHPAGVVDLAQQKAAGIAAAGKGIVAG